VSEQSESPPPQAEKGELRAALQLPPTWLLILGEILLIWGGLQLRGGRRWQAGGGPSLPLDELGEWLPRALGIVALLGLIVYGLLAFQSRASTKSGQGKGAAFLGPFFLAGLMAIAGTAAMQPGGLARWGRSIASPRITSVYSDSVRLTAPQFRQLLAEFPAHVRHYPRAPNGESPLHNHSATKPPGFLILFRPFRSLGAMGSAIAAWLIVLCYLLGLFPLASLLGRRPGAASTSVPIALLAYLLMPSVLRSAPGLDLLYPPLLLLAYERLRSGLQSGTTLPILVSGLTVGAALCLSYLPLVWLAALWLPVLLYRRAQPPAFLISRAALWLGLALLPQLLLSVPFEWSPVTLFAACQSSSHWIDAQLDRAYLPWLWGNLIDQALILGLPLLVLVGARLRRDAWTEPTLVIVAAASLIALSGITRDETARTWIFLHALLCWSLGDEDDQPRLRALGFVHLVHIALVTLSRI